MTNMHQPIIAILAFTASLAAQAEADNSWLAALKQQLRDTWEQSEHTDLYLPMVTYHNRSTYSKDKIETFNEQPWGLGIGTSYKDANQNWNGYYAMAFKDSHNDWEPIVGYGHVGHLAGDARHLNAGLGWTAGFTARSDYHYKPLPVILPIAALGYNAVTVNATYVPGTKGNGNVLFMWSTIAF